MNVICATDFFDRMEAGTDEVRIRDFFRKDFKNFEKFISGKIESDFELETLIPEGIDFDIAE